MPKCDTSYEDAAGGVWERGVCKPLKVGVDPVGFKTEDKKAELELP